MKQHDNSEEQPTTPPFPWVIPIPNVYQPDTMGNPVPVFIQEYMLKLVLHEDGSVTWDI